MVSHFVCDITANAPVIKGVTDAIVVGTTSPHISHIFHIISHIVIRAEKIFEFSYKCSAIDNLEFKNFKEYKLVKYKTPQNRDR